MATGSLKLTRSMLGMFSQRTNSSTMLIIFPVCISCDQLRVPRDESGGCLTSYDFGYNLSLQARKNSIFVIKKKTFT